MSVGSRITSHLQSPWARSAKAFALGVIPLAIVACGGSASPTDTVVAAPLATATTTLVVQGSSSLPEGVAGQLVVPTFHLAPVAPEAPSDVDAADSAASAKMAPRSTAIPPELLDLPTKRLTLQDINSVQQKSTPLSDGLLSSPVLAPLAGTAAVVTYTPAQIRAAYGLPALTAVTSTLTSAQAAQMGAGQTIYIIDAMHNPNVVAELSAFNQKFGLPACSVKAVAANAALPLAAPSSTACELSVVYATAAGGMTTAAPAYNAGWATEIAMDVQWSHATAPLARIVLIEVPDASLNSFVGGIKLANSMGPGVVSMSFGAAEGSWTASVDSLFTTPKMTYIASSGDSGVGVNWPAVSANVLAVGGTSLTYGGTTARSEVSWSGSGGGTSAYVPVATYQANTVPGMGTVARRNVPDVAFNADPATGQYVAVINPGSATVGWASAGGTSISAPQWAGVVAMTNAIRAANAKVALGSPHTAIYKQLASVPGVYASTFADITKGSNGSCVTCTAKIGYDPVTGLGTPNGASLISALAGAAVTVVPPVVTPAAITGNVGTALTFTVSVAAPNPVSYTLSGAPSGMAINSAGVVSWATPLAGTYAVTVTAKDTVSGLSGQGIYTVTVGPAKAPVVTTTTVGPVITAPAMIGVAGKALSGPITITDSTAAYFSVSISGVPLGMGFSISGQTITAVWASPVTGSYNLKIVVVDSAGRSAQATVPVTITAK